MIGLVVSRADSASVAIGEELRSIAAWESREDPERSDADGGGTYYRHGDFELREFDEWHLELDGVADAFSEVPEFVAFLSRHSGDTGPLLTAHFTGNFGPAEYGGRPGELSRACPNVQRAVVEAFDRHAPDGYEVGIEGTHHGPSDVGAPSLFVELGSSEAEWDDPEGARAVARAVLELSGVPADADARAGVEVNRGDAPDDDTSATTARDCRHVVGFGGGHYAPQFERVVRETEWAVGHVASDWVLKSMGSPAENAAVIDEAFEQSAATRALVVDGDPEVEAVVEDLGHRVVNETWLRETSGVDLDLVEALESDLSTVDDGLRFGSRAADGSDEGTAGDDGRGGYDVVSLPDDLLAEASGIARDAAFEAVESRVVAFETVEGGTKPRGRAAVLDRAALDEVVDGLARVLESKYDDVRVESERVIATREAFDPAAAAAAGVPEGPAFGRLSAGETVEVDGDEVTPADVTTSERVSFSTPERGARPDIQ
ncbi:D-aminoacyl-tRNA deacylase [Halobellus rufus]|uniref:D-aminoacyl-tRNA deacylase n=1 Tax=Halobellus rufus TaxID=1448860 RepID=UPI000678771D|nr:D-aminoacyl-tRNA deacylase [Halobellus rufus]